MGKQGRVLYELKMVVSRKPGFYVYNVMCGWMAAQLRSCLYKGRCIFTADCAAGWLHQTYGPSLELLNTIEQLYFANDNLKTFNNWSIYLVRSCTITAGWNDAWTRLHGRHELTLMLSGSWSGESPHWPSFHSSSERRTGTRGQLAKRSCF